MRSVICLLFLIPILGFGNLQEKDSLQLKYDTDSRLEERSFNQDLSQKYQGDEFNYEIKTGESQNLLLRFLRWLFGGLGEIFGFDVSPNALKVIQYFIYVLMGLLVIYLLVRFLVNERFGSIFTKKANSILDVDLSEQHIESLDLDSLMNEALQKKDYRLAVRYQFLKVLKRLSQKQLIDWHFEKTNSDYEKELKENRLRAKFKEVSYLYEHIWYGENPITERQYQKTDDRFNTLNTLIPL
ncbi:DUF4129 domain-containing protein [Flagellimonas meridianipacifica]|uniref:Uncharacterized protein DUF4129 n=1 Tax=Flagellimonas meridianipacifica TaxID=1080225 RepID=A0A2T0MDB9_9FLAO|nr:DUF4129 domain-containing protein [Allomuricauda pacifica]PRX55491.1 uncharacterized protein DUF4129 [Allomuricauda pacifica]